MFAPSSNYPRCRGRCLFPVNSQRFTRGWEKGNKYIMHTKIAKEQPMRGVQEPKEQDQAIWMEMSRVMCKPDEQMYECVRVFWAGGGGLVPVCTLIVSKQLCLVDYHRAYRL